MHVLTIIDVLLVREERSESSMGNFDDNFDDQCISDVCCQGDSEVIYVLVNTSCKCLYEGIYQ